MLYYYPSVSFFGGSKATSGEDYPSVGYADSSPDKESQGVPQIRTRDSAKRWLGGAWQGEPRRVELKYIPFLCIRRYP